MITGRIDSSAKLKASSIREKAKAATNTPLPKAIIVAIIFFGRFTKDATIDPISRGILAINPHSKDPNKVTANLIVHQNQLYKVFY